MTTITAAKLTVADYRAQIPEDHEGIIELIDGVIVSEREHNLPKRPHQLTLGSIYIALRTLLGRDRVFFAPLNVYLDDTNYVEPDVFYIGGDDSTCRAGEDGFFYGAPALIVEVISSTSVKRDRVDKFALYEKFGVREYWLVETDALFIEVYTLEEGRYRRVGAYVIGDVFTSPLLNHSFDVSTLLEG